MDKRLLAEANWVRQGAESCLALAVFHIAGGVICELATALQFLSLARVPLQVRTNPDAPQGKASMTIKLDHD